MTERKLLPRHSHTGSRYEKLNGVRVAFHPAMKFPGGVKIRKERRYDGQIECLRHSKDTPMGCHCPSLETAQLGYRLNGSLQCDVFNFSFLQDARILHRFLYIVSRAIVQMIDREKNVRKCHGDVEHIRLYYSVSRTRCELKKLKG